jgi:hypothetical protein
MYAIAADEVSSENANQPMMKLKLKKKKKNKETKRFFIKNFFKI